jgi:hypothetical protein
VHSWSETTIRPTVRLAVIAVALQATHFIVEFTTGFHERFPELLGLAPWSVQFCVAFNLFWLALWSLGVWALAARQREALFLLWFLAIGCSANGVAHPLISMRTGDYFPGLVIFLVVGFIGVLLLRRLARITEPHTA